jgi:hypothetical protein
MYPPSVPTVRDPPSKVSSRTAPSRALKRMGPTTRDVTPADTDRAPVSASLPGTSPAAAQSTGSLQRNPAFRVEYAMRMVVCGSALNETDRVAPSTRLESWSLKRNASASA